LSRISRIRFGSFSDVNGFEIYGIFLDPQQLAADIRKNVASRGTRSLSRYQMDWPT